MKKGKITVRKVEDKDSWQEGKNEKQAKIENIDEVDEVWVRFILPEQAKGWIPPGILPHNRNGLRQKARGLTRMHKEKVEPVTFQGVVGIQFIDKIKELGFNIRTLQYIEETRREPPKYPVVMIFSKEEGEIQIDDGTMKVLEKLFEHPWPTINVYHNEKEREIKKGSLQKVVTIDAVGFFRGFKMENPQRITADQLLSLSP